MPREVAISVIRRIEAKYGGWDGIMIAATNGRLKFADFHEYYEACEAIGV